MFDARALAAVPPPCAILARKPGSSAENCPAVASGEVLPGQAPNVTLGYEFWLTWEQWFRGDALAQLVVTPVIFYWVSRGPMESVGPFRDTVG